MAKNFKKAGASASFDTVGKESSKFAQVPPIMMLANEDILDYPHNDEDTTHTEDIESSIKSFGFTDPIEVTDYGMDEGKYMIVSGHRRRAAGVRCGITEFPCIVIHLPSSDKEDYDPIADYVLMANSHRDSAKDPLLLARRYKRHKALLVAQGVKDFRKQLAERMGIAVSHASRLEAMSQLIMPLWDLVERDIVGMSAVSPLNQFSESEQEEICKIISECAAANSYDEDGVQRDGHVSRETMKDIIKGYKNGCRSWREIPKPLRDSGLPRDYGFDDDNGEAPSSTNGFNGNGADGYTPSDDNPDYTDVDSLLDESGELDNDNPIIDFGGIEEQAEQDEEQAEIDLAERLFKHLKSTITDLDNPDLSLVAVGTERAEEILRVMKGCAINLINSIDEMGVESGIESSKISDLVKEIKEETERFV